MTGGIFATATSKSDVQWVALNPATEENEYTTRVAENIQRPADLKTSENSIQCLQNC